MHRHLKTALARSVLPLLGALTFVCLAHGQPVEPPSAYPSKAVRIVVPYAPGGGVDTIMRLLAPRLQAILGQSFTVENRAGAATVIATEYVARSRPDGYVLLAPGAPIALNTALRMPLPYDPLKDLAPISLVVTLPGLILVPPDSPARTLKDLVDLSRKAPGGLRYGSPGVGSIAHLGGELLRAKSGAVIQHVGYKGSAPALNDLLGGQLPMLMDALIPSAAQVKAGRAVALAITSPTRSPMLPNVPTSAEAGYPGVVFGGTFGLMAPAGTHPEVIAKLHAAVLQAVSVPEMRRQLMELGYEVVANKPPEYAAFLREEIATWSKIVKDNDIKAQ